MATATWNGGGQLQSYMRTLDIKRREMAAEIRHEPIKYVVLVLAAAFLIVLVAYPMFLLFKFSLLTKTGEFTFGNYIEAFDRPGLFRALKNSLILAVTVPVGCMALGLPMAWAVSRTNMPFKLLIRALSGIAFVIPSFIGSIAWIFLLAPNSGQLNMFLMYFFGLENMPFNIFSMTGLIFILTMHYYPSREYGGGHQGECHPEGGAQAARPEGAGGVLVGGIDVVQRGAYRKKNQGIVMQGQDEDKAGHREYVEWHLLQAEQIHEKHVQLSRIRGQQKDPGDRSDKRGDDEGNSR